MPCGPDIGLNSATLQPRAVTGFRHDRSAPAAFEDLRHCFDARSLAREPCGLFCRQAGDVTNVLSRLARYFRSPAYLLMGLVLSMSIAGVWLLVTNVTQIRASLPIEVLHRDRELADLLYEVSRLEALLDRVRLGDTEIDNRDLRLAVGEVRIRLSDRPGAFGGDLGRELESLHGRIHTTLAALDSTLRGSSPAILRAIPAYFDDVVAQRRALRALSISASDATMAQAAEQGDALSRLYSRTTVVIGLLGAFGLSLLQLLNLQRRVIRRQEAAEKEVRQLSFFDPLTGLANRRTLTERLRHALAVHARQHLHGALLFIDLDHFKTLNETRGHAFGDQLLREVARRLVDCVPDAATIARLGGDEFVVMLEDIGPTPEAAARQAESVARAILDALNQTYLLADDETHSTPSIGIALFDAQGEQVDELLKRADLAMYQAKEAGRNTLRFFDPVIQQRVREQSELEADLRRGLRDGQFSLRYQAQFDREGRAVGAEALVRWRHPFKGMVPPADFIPLAESSGLILPLGRWVMRAACRELKAWQLHDATRGLTMAVNVSARQFRHSDFVAEVEAVLHETGAPPSLLKLEITESLLLEDADEVIARMRCLRQLGVSFAIDDFGTGYSSLAYLKRLPLSQLKIDRSFVRDVLTDSNDAAIARTVIGLGRSLGLQVVGEGVETAEQHAFLLSHGCDAFQGFLLGKPVPDLRDALLARTLPAGTTASVPS